MKIFAKGKHRKRGINKKITDVTLQNYIDNPYYFVILIEAVIKTTKRNSEVKLEEINRYVSDIYSEEIYDLWEKKKLNLYYFDLSYGGNILWSFILSIVVSFMFSNKGTIFLKERLHFLNNKLNENFWVTYFIFLVVIIVITCIVTCFLINVRQKDKTQGIEYVDYLMQKNRLNSK